MSNVLEQIFYQNNSRSEVTEETEERLKDIYGERYLRALKLVDERKITKYIFYPSGVERWVVEGRKGNYLVIPRIFCQCNDFYMSVVIKRRVDACYHLIAQTIAELKGEYKKRYMDDKEYNSFMLKFRIFP